jgi:hypothetical protein
MLMGTGNNVMLALCFSSTIEEFQCVPMHYACVTHLKHNNVANKEHAFFFPEICV